MFVLWQAWRPNRGSADRSNGRERLACGARDVRGLIETETATWPELTKSAHSLSYALRC
jgi:hypothetical protein